MKNRVLLFLVVLMCAATFLPFLGVASNRIVTPTGIGLFSVFYNNSAWLIFVPLLLGGVFLKPTRATHIFLVLLSSLSMMVLLYATGRYAAQVDEAGSTVARVSFGGGFWVLLLLLWLVAVDAVGRLTNSVAYRSVGALLVFAPLFCLLLSGSLSHLSMLKEYANNRVVFDDALARHLFIVILTLVITLLIGIPLGIAAFFYKKFGAMVLKILSVIQTIPSIALFGLLIAPLAALSTRFSWLSDLGIKGVGITPAVIALTLYSLLPIVRSVVSGLAQVPISVIEAAQGMGMTHRQILWRVQARLSLPVLLSGVRVTTVQAVGLTVVAALIGAGGFGAIVFRGLSGSAIDLVLLGVIPVVVLAVCADALFKIIVSFLTK